MKKVVVGYININWKRHFRYYTVKELNERVCFFPGGMSKVKEDERQSKVRITIEEVG